MFPAEAVARFWSKVDKTDDCWIWLGGTINGYGRFQVQGRRYGAHRFSFLLTHGEIAEYVCHTCDTPLCVNPSHLFAGSPQANAADMQRKGRKANQDGTNNGRAKLTNSDVLEIRRLRGANVPVQDLADKFGVSKSNISMAANGKSWKYLP